MSEFAELTRATLRQMIEVALDHKRVLHHGFGRIRKILLGVWGLVHLWVPVRPNSLNVPKTDPGSWL